MKKSYFKKMGEFAIDVAVYVFLFVIHFFLGFLEGLSLTSLIMGMVGDICIDRLNNPLSEIAPVEELLIPLQNTYIISKLETRSQFS